jgi:hypothetical protein
MKKLLTCCPVADTENLNLIPRDFQFQPGHPISAFDAQVHWIQESEARVCITQGAELASYNGRYTDREGYLSSLDQAYRECRHLMEINELNAFSPNGLQIQVDVFRTPVFDLFSRDIKFSWDKHTNWKQYDVVAEDWCEIQFPDQAISSKNVVKPIKRKIMLSKHLVWHSKLPINEHMDAITEFKEKWVVGDFPTSITQRKRRRK